MTNQSFEYLSKLVFNLQSNLQAISNRRELSHSGYHAFFLAVLSCLLLFANLHRGDLSGYDDAVYAHEARVVLQTGDWFTLRLNGYPDFDKPPLFVWMVTTSFKLFGISDFAAKIPAALFGLGTILLTYCLAKRLSDERWIPVLSMFVLMSTQYFLKYSMHAMTGVPFTFFFTLAIYFYVRGMKAPVFFLWCGVAVGLATLTKSPMGLFPLAIISFHLIFTRRFDLLFSRYMAGCLILSLSLPLVWYVREYQLFGDEFLAQHFANIANHTVITQSKSLDERIAWYFEYPILLTKHYWPWLPFMLIGLMTALKQTFRERLGAPALLCFWVLCVIVPFSFADSKVLRYILPAFPAFSVLAAVALNSLIARRRKNFFKLAYSIISLAVLAATIFPNYKVRAGNMRSMAPVVQSATLPGQRVLLYTSGRYDWDYRNKLLWYGDRLCWHLLNLEQVCSLLECDPNFVAIINREALDGVTEKMGRRFQVLGKSENFLCVRFRN